MCPPFRAGVGGERIAWFGKPTTDAPSVERTTNRREHLSCDLSRRAIRLLRQRPLAPRRLPDGGDASGELRRAPCASCGFCETHSPPWATPFPPWPVARFIRRRLTSRTGRVDPRPRRRTPRLRGSGLCSDCRFRRPSSPGPPRRLPARNENALAVSGPVSRTSIPPRAVRLVDVRSSRTALSLFSAVPDRGASGRHFSTTKT
jgi:hypothetical protein